MSILVSGGPRKGVFYSLVSIEGDIVNWDLNVLRQAVEKLYGPEHLAKLLSSLNSIVERQEFSRFHFHESKDALEKILHDKTDQTSLLRLVLSFGSEDREMFKECKFRASAHITSCIQNMHSVSDILSHVIYYSLNIRSAKNESAISLKYVHKQIKAIVELDALDKMLESLINHKDYEYLAAVVNHSKHRSIVEPYFNVNLRKQGKDMQEMRFREFVYSGKGYPSRHAYEFFESEFNRESTLIIDIGNEVNRIVLDKC